MKPWMIFAGIGTLGLGAFLFYKMRTAGQVPLIAGPGGQLASVNPNLLTQPSSAYPVTAPAVTRQDNASEPWATTQTKAVNQSLPSSQLANQNLLQNIELAKGAQSLVGSLTSIWDDLDLGSLWSDGGSNLVEEDTLEGFDWGSYSSSFSFN